MKAVHTALVALALASAATPTGAQKPPPITGETVRVIEAWADAVQSHVPGSHDEGVRAVAEMTYNDRVQLDAGMEMFLDALGGRYNTGGSPAGKAIVARARAAGIPDAAGFRKRAAILHADAAPRRGLADGPNQSERQPSRFGPGVRVSPILQSTSLPLTRDGEIISQTTATWHLPFARYLLDRVGTRENPDPFVAAWYHATNAELFSRAAYGDLTSHLDHGERILPNDPWLLFDRACYAEVLGSPLLQTVVTERDEVTARLNNRGGPPAWRPPVDAAASRIPQAARTNAEAERLYRRALAIEPSLVEARLRLARLLDIRGRHQDAAAELAIAAGQAPPGILGFYTHLFAGRTSQALGRMDDASRHYHAALELFPHAQSALVASSQLALLRSDVTAALAPIAQLGDRSADSDSDPWWIYYLCAGRDFETLQHAMWNSLPR